jgi:site-specific recombinase XerD
MGPVQLMLHESEPLTPLTLHYQSFLLDRAAARCTAKTLAYYRYTVGSFASWLLGQGVNSPQEITPNHIRQYLISLQRRGLRDTSQHGHARGIKVWLRWLVAEGELDKSPMDRVSMPRVDRKMQPPFSPDDVMALLQACSGKSPRDLRSI